MEKTTFKPVTRELIYKTSNEKSFYDILSSLPNKKQEKYLGTLYIVGHVKYDSEDMGYLVNLISSLAKREYYSDSSLDLEDPKKAFEQTLKKLNEVLGEFFQNKQFELNMGLIVVAGESIYISKLGKFGILLERNDDLIDILNNINLFQKDHIEEKEFSSIISGKIKIKDKIFAFFPSKAISTRKKFIEKIFLDSNQDNFEKSIRELRDKSKNFPFCGIHIEIQEFKEPAIEIKSEGEETLEISKDYYPEKKISATNGSVATPISSVTSAPESLDPEEKINHQSSVRTFIPPIIRDMSLIKRANIITKAWGSLTSTQWLGSMQKATKKSTAIGIIAIVFSLIVLGKFVLGGGYSKEVTATLETAKDNIKLAQNYLTQNQPAMARNVLGLSLVSLSSLDQSNEKADELRGSLLEILDRIDLVNSNQPELVSNLSEDATKITLLGENSVIILNKNGDLFDLSNNKTISTISGSLDSTIFSEDITIGVLSDGNLTTISIDTGSKLNQTLKNSSGIKDSNIYLGNLYTLEESGITKYSDISKGKASSQNWLKESADTSSSQIAIDGNIYVLTTNGKLITYYKGEKKNEFQLPVSPKENDDILTGNDLNFLAYVIPSINRVMIFSKESGGLQRTYKMDSLGGGKIISWDLSDNGVLFVLSDSKTIWKIDLNN